MPLILHIDSSTETASVALSEDGKELSKRGCTGPKEQAAFIQPAIQDIFSETNHSIRALSAVSVTIGPGSYTGLRVGLASAKGICYALNLPLITLFTTEVMSAAAIPIAQKHFPQSPEFLVCPMIDARRMEVFLAVYDQSNQCLQTPTAAILDQELPFLESIRQPVFFFGSGASKFQSICQIPQAYFGEVNWDAGNMIELANTKFEHRDFASLELSVPMYVKPFHTLPPKQII